MSGFAAIESTPLSWVQPRTLERSFELRAGDAPVGALSFRSSFGTFALAEARAGRWTYKRVGFLNPRVTVRVENASEDLAIYQPRFWGGGDLGFRDGTVFAWKPTNFWTTEWAFLDGAAQAVAHFHPGVAGQRLRDALKTQATVDVAPAGFRLDALPVLLTLGLYLLVLHQADTAATVGATGAATG